MNMAKSRQQLLEAYKHACEIELQAFKPGNVSVYAEGHGMTVEDFRVSAKVSAEAITDPRNTLGEKIYYAVKATREAVGCNTNLGIVLLCAPLLQAAADQSGVGLRAALRNILKNTTLADADWVFRAIKLASPGGLGESKQQDVNQAPGVTLTQAMAIASEKDRIAKQYITNYKDIFEFSILRYNEILYRWGISEWAAVSVYTRLLSRFPDSHIERKYGSQFNELVSSRMTKADRALSKINRPELLTALLYAIDQEFKASGINPGTTADMTVATVLSVILGGH